jgi:hypothetical protein
MLIVYALLIAAGFIAYRKGGDTAMQVVLLVGAIIIALTIGIDSTGAISDYP